MALFTAANAAEMGRRSAEARRLANERPLVVPELPLNIADPFAEAIAQACGETLKELREATKASDKAALARTLRDLRETYHNVTGQAKAGQLRPVQPRQPKQSQVEPLE